MKVLVTGGTGHLGSAMVPLLLQQGHELRVLSRRAGGEPRVAWVKGDLSSSHDLSAAVAGVDIVIHAATSSPIAQRGAMRLSDFFHSPTHVDVAGTEALLEQAARSGVKHFVHVSIVGLEDTKRLPYSRVKLAAEDAVRRSRVPWSIVRATKSFYWLLERLCANMVKGLLLMLPTDVRMQPLDSADFAKWVVACATDEHRGRRADYAGPQVLTLREIVQQYLAARGLRRRIWKLPLPRAVLAAVERGQTIRDGHLGATTWATWLGAL